MVTVVGCEGDISKKGAFRHCLASLMLRARKLNYCSSRLFGAMILVLCMVESIAFADPAAGKGSATVAPDSRASASVDIDLGNSPDTGEVSISFERANDDKEQLVVTALSLAHGGCLRQMTSVEGVELDEYVAWLSGWYVFHSGIHELWVGVKLRRGVSRAKVSFRIPELVFLSTEGPIEEWELTYSDPDPLLANMVDKVAGATYATVTQVHAERPRWGAVLDESTGWVKKPGRIWSADIKAGPPRILRLRREQSLFSEWLDNALATTFMAFATGGMFVVALLSQRGIPSRKSRAISGFFSVLVLFLALRTLPTGSLMRAIVLTRGPVICFALPFLAYATFRVSWLKWLVKLANIIRKDKGGIQ